MSHRHVDPNDGGETYGMPTQSCIRCGYECCIDCTIQQANRKLVCDFCFDEHNEKKKEEMNMSRTRGPAPGTRVKLVRCTAVGRR